MLTQVTFLFSVMSIILEYVFLILPLSVLLSLLILLPLPVPLLRLLPLPFLLLLPFSSSSSTSFSSSSSNCFYFLCVLGAGTRVRGGLSAYSSTQHSFLLKYGQSECERIRSQSSAYSKGPAGRGTGSKNSTIIGHKNKKLPTVFLPSIIFFFCLLFIIVVIIFFS